MPEPNSDTEPSKSAASPGGAPYRVLARKYRPATFDALIGQEALVRTLSNAFRSGRLAQAYMLSGVRGIGKTTTARIIARALNCVGRDGGGSDASSGPTATPCGVCEHCVAIAEDRHVDVLEMDAASRTGIDDIREVIEGVRYRPTSARYKVYIIDEVHMLSKNAFNALLKTLEEPPEHVRFLFATTEIRKVPVTVLSRCQRFDLRRVDAATLAAHLAGIVAQENATAEPEALHIVARAADGSVRDGLSLLDQAIAHTDGVVTAEAVRAMLGLADRTKVFDLFDAAMRGDAPAALALLADLDAVGGDAALVFEDLLDLTHWLTRIKVAPEAADAPGIPEVERTRGRAMADRLSMGEVTRAWQMLLKGLGEIRFAPSPLQAAEMVLVRLVYASRLPTPEEALKAWGSGRPPVPAGSTPNAPADVGSGRASDAVETAASATNHPPARHPPQPLGGRSHSPSAALVQPVDDSAAEPRPRDDAGPRADPQSFRDAVELVSSVGEGELSAHLRTLVHLVHFEAGKIEIHLDDLAPRDLTQRWARLLNAHTRRRWWISVAKAGGELTLEQQDRTAEAAALSEVARHPLIREILDVFPGATVDSVRPAPAPPGGEPPDIQPDAALVQDTDDESDPTLSDSP
ncbi:MAG: DNA polymerase III subunit gamma/tau [Rhodospirillales bacterium]|nr:DNA polymerase III subunit gamma/tau [Rhodospirillales bacterium]